MKEGDCMTVLRREDEDEVEWWWARLNEKEGYVPRNLLGVEERYLADVMGSELLTLEMSVSESGFATLAASRILGSFSAV
ncbi:hypothetical protein QTO34_012485 [Cnephaeus nilssonii]|uniref:SH3 domain-containing protein n=1 Tax=Cnephaeus nilssonii TaxID=3371016 RepID=A0AA40LE07_CNENI|nr:hypothetical protein QTO34_012485 [Eptesicus nilssonii]